MNRLYTKHSPINGNGLYTNETLNIGDHVGYVHGTVKVFRQLTPTISKKILDWIGVGRHSWIDTSDSEFKFINHSCDPNVALVTKRKVIAIKEIGKHEEITMDYSLTEAEANWSIKCNCQTKNCRKKIGPIQTLPKHVFNRYKHLIPPNFVKIYNVAHTN